MKKVAPVQQQVAAVANEGAAGKEQSSKREKASTRVMLCLSLADLGFTALPYAWQMYPTFFYVGNSLLSTPITYVGSILTIVKPAINFYIFWALIPSFKQGIRSMFGLSEAESSSQQSS